MAEENNAPNPSGEDSNANASGQPPAKDEGASSQPTVDPAEQARRDQQSKKDKANSELDDTTERLSFLEAREMERARDEYVSELLTSSDKFPDVKADDPLFRYAGSKEEVEEIATQLQNRFKDMQQRALESVQTEGADKLLTDEEIEQANKELEKKTRETGQSTFSSFLSNIQRRKG